jgi:hypothetical protein
MVNKAVIHLNSKTIESEYSENNYRGRPGYLFENLENQYTYSEIKNLTIQSIPSNSQLEILEYNQKYNKELFEVITYPFRTVIFDKNDTCFYIEFISSTDGQYDQEWHNEFTWTYDALFNMVAKQIDSPSIIFERVEYVGSIEYCVKIADVHSQDIHTGVIDTTKKLNDLIQQARQGLQGIQRFIDVIGYWTKNKNNSNENDWHSFFNKNNWVLSQCFSIPAVLFQNKAYVGGKDLTNRSGGVLDILYRSKLLENLALVEIKTPLTPILSREYRDNVFSISSDLSGSINQLLHYRDNIEKEYYILNGKCIEGFQLFSPKCILVIGTTETLSDRQKVTFELFRSDLKSVEIITYDELFEKLNLLKELLLL